MSRKIAIVGTCPSSRTLALRLPDDWALWVCAPGNEAFPRVDAWFELHEDLDYPCEGGRWQRYIDWLNLQTFPVYAQGDELIRRAIRFPIERLVDAFGLYFFSSQVALMFAFAIESGATHVGLFGVDMAARSEYAHQKLGLLHFVTIARQRGIEVVAPPETEVLMPPPLYGYSFASPIGRKLRTRELEVRQEIARMEAERATLDARLQHFRGVLDDVDWAQQSFTGGLYVQDGVEEVQPGLRTMRGDRPLRAVE